jgi:hypothetical protein
VPARIVRSSERLRAELEGFGLAGVMPSVRGRGRE